MIICEHIKGMKHYILILFSLLSIGGFSQSTQEVPFYMDSVKINPRKVFIAPTSLQYQNITHKTPTGEVHFTLKKNVRFLTLNEVLKAYLSMEDNDNVLYYIDDEIIYDKKDIRLDSVIIKKVEKFDMSKVDYINKKLQGMTIVKIRLTTYHYHDDDTIWVRGEK